MVGIVGDVDGVADNTVNVGFDDGEEREGHGRRVNDEQ